MRAVPLLDVPAMTAEVREAVDDAWATLLHTGDFVRGRAVTQFEESWAGYCGTEHAIGVANGTDALWLALRALGLDADAEVIVPANTFVATVEAIVHAGLRPVFADVDPDTLLLTPETVNAALTPRTRALVVVHLYGQMPDMDALSAIADQAKLVLVEDAAQAHGAQWRGRRAGSFGIAGCFSFYPGKNLGAFGDAGAIVTSDDALAQLLRTMTDHGRTPGTRHQHDVVGFNSRLDTIQAAVLSAKLRYLEDWNRRRRIFVDLYRELLAGSGIRLVAALPGGEPVWHLAVAQVPNRAEVQSSLAAQNIGSGIHYPTPCHLLPPYRAYAKGTLPVAEAAAERIISLPLSPHMHADDVGAVCDVLQNAVPSAVAAHA